MYSLYLLFRGRWAWCQVSGVLADFVYAEYLAECGGVEYRQMVFQIAEDFARATLLRLPGYCPMPAFAAVEDVPLVARPPRQSPAQVRVSVTVTCLEALIDANLKIHALPSNLRKVV